MKTVFKRLLSFVLVAMMLVSIVPFQASATAEREVVPFSATFYVWNYETGAFDQVGTAYEDGVYKGALIGTDTIANGLGVDTSKYEEVKFYYNTESGWVEFTAIDTADENIDGTIQIQVQAKAEQEFTVSYVVTGGSTTKTYTDKVAKDTKVDGSKASSVWEKDFPSASFKFVSASPAGEVTVTENKTIEITLSDRRGEIELIDPKKTGDQLYTKLDTIDGDLVEALPAAPEHNGYVFTRWNSAENGTGEDLTANAKDVAARYYAQYETTQNNDKRSTLTVKVKVFTGDRYGYEFTVLTIPELADGTDILDLLYDKKQEISSKIFNDLGFDRDNHEWEQRYFFDNTFKDELTQTNAKMDGNVTVYIKLRNLNTAKVMLYVHKSVTERYSTIIEMEDYAVGDTLYKADIKEALKKKYPDATYSFTGMYSEEDWTDLVNEKNPTALASFDIDEKNVEVHILATKTSGAAADTSNPKTGDAILMAVTVLGVSASALAVMYYLNKKKTI